MRTRHVLKAFGSDPLRLEWRLRTPADRGEVWPLFADTERWNRALREDIDYVLEDTPDGIERVGLTRMGGRKVRYVERRFDFREGRSSFVDRVFEGGPFQRYTVEVRLRDGKQGGTRASYALEFWPRSRLERPLCAVGLRVDLVPRIERVLGEVQRILAGEGLKLDPPPPPLKARAARRLDERLAQLDDRDVAGLLGTFLNEAPEVIQARIQARLLARQWNLPEGRVVDALLQGVQRGLLEMRWELLCPSCIGPSAQSERLDMRALAAHCPSCNIRYDASFADGVAVTFRPSADIRPLDLPLVCVGSPRKTPHIAARRTLDPGELAVLELDLAPGAWRVRDLSSLHGCHLEVGVGAASGEAVVVTAADGVAEPTRIRRAPGPLRLSIRNRTGRRSMFIVEQRWRPAATLTAGMVLERPRVRELLPSSNLPPDLTASVRPAGILVGEVFEAGGDGGTEVAALLETMQPSGVHRGPRHVVATWPKLASAIEAASRFQGAWQACTAVAWGPVLEVGADGQTQPTGSTVLAASEALRCAPPGRTALPGDLAADQEVERVLDAAEGRLELEPGPLVGGRTDYLLLFGGEPRKPRLAPATVGHPDDQGLEGLTIDGRYRLGEQLGQGGFGTVYAATDRHTGTDVVLKILKGSLLTQPDEVDSFLSEACVLSRLQHPHVVRFLDFGHGEAGHLYLAMERLEGQTLQERIEQRVLSASEAVAVGIAAARGLEGLHAAGLLHRDVKPENLFLSGPDLGRDTKLLDLGIAIDLKAARERDPDGMAVGTMAFAAPEQLAAEPMDVRADVYALGMSLWTALVGDVPYGDSESGMAMVMRRIREGVPPVQRVAPQVPGVLADVISRAVAVHPRERFASARGMREALEVLV